MQHLTFSYACVQGFFWSCYAAVMGFVSFYLRTAGFDNSTIGALIAAGGLVSAVAQPVVAGYADRPGSISLKRILTLAGTASTVFAAALLLLRGSGWMTGAFYVLCIILLQLTTPLVNSLGVETVNSGERMNFGIARGVGSFGYAAAAYVLGAVTDRFGAVTVPVSMTAVFGLFLLSVLRYPTIRAEKQQSAAGAGTGAGFLKKYPRYALVLGGCVMLFISHTVLNNFTYQIAVAKGGGSEEMGTAMALAGMIELPTMFCFGWMLKKKRCDFWFRISGIFFMLKCLGTLLCTTIPGFYAVQVFQLFGWALISVSAVYYINAIMAPEDTVKGQAYYTVSMTLGNVIGPIIAGWILDAMDVQAMLVFGTVCGLIGAVILLFGGEKTA